MASTVKQLRDAVKAALDTIKGVGQPLQATFAYMEPNPEEFPCAMVDIASSGADEFYTSDSNLLTVRFRIHVQIPSRNNLATADSRLDLIEAVRNLFSEEPYVDDLSNVCEVVRVDGIEPFQGDDSNSPKIGFDLYLACSAIRSKD